MSFLKVIANSSPNTCARKRCAARTSNTPAAKRTLSAGRGADGRDWAAILLEAWELEAFGNGDM
jgi:hypothetical protein